MSKRLKIGLILAVVLLVLVTLVWASQNSISLGKIKFLRNNANTKLPQFTEDKNTNNGNRKLVDIVISIEKEDVESFIQDLKNNKIFFTYFHQSEMFPSIITMGIEESAFSWIKHHPKVKSIQLNSSSYPTH